MNDRHGKRQTLPHTERQGLRQLIEVFPQTKLLHDLPDAGFELLAWKVKQVSVQAQILSDRQLGIE